MRIAAFLIVFLIFSVFLAAIYGVMQFDPNTFKSVLEDALEKELSYPVRIANLEIKWQFPLELRLQDLEVLSPSSQRPFLRAPRVKAAFRVMPLLKRQLVVESFELENSRLAVVRDEQLAWNWKFANNQPTSRSPQKGWSVTFHSFQAPDISIYYADRSVTPFIHAHWDHWDLSVSNENSWVWVQARIPVKSKEDQALLSLKIHSQGEAEFEGNYHEFLKIQGKVRELFKNFDYDTAWSVKRVDMDLFLKFFGKKFPFQGKLSGKAEASGSGPLHPSTFFQNLLLKGDFVLENAVINNSNWVHQVLEGMKPIPGFSELMRHPFDVDYYEELEGPQTLLGVFGGKIKIIRAGFFLENAFWDHSLYSALLEGQGNLNSGVINLKGEMTFNPVLSLELIRRVQDLDVLLNRDDKIVVPFLVEGLLEKSQASPELRFIAHRLIQIKGEYLASQGVQKINEFLETFR